MAKTKAATNNEAEANDNAPSIPEKEEKRPRRAAQAGLEEEGETYSINDAINFLSENDLKAAEMISGLAERVGVGEGIMVEVERVGPETYQLESGEIIDCDKGYWRELPFGALAQNPRETIARAIGGGQYILTCRLNAGRYGKKFKPFEIGGRPLPMTRGRQREFAAPTSGLAQVREVMSLVTELIAATKKGEAMPAIDPLAQIEKAVAFQERIRRSAMSEVQQMAKAAAAMNPSGTVIDDGTEPEIEPEVDPMMALIQQGLEILKGNDSVMTLVRSQLGEYAAGRVEPATLAGMIKAAATSAQGKQILSMCLSMEPEAIGGLLSQHFPESRGHWQTPEGIQQIAALKRALSAAPRKPRAAKTIEGSATPAPAADQAQAQAQG